MTESSKLISVISGVACSYTYNFGPVTKILPFIRYFQCIFIDFNMTIRCNCV